MTNTPVNLPQYAQNISLLLIQHPKLLALLAGALYPLGFAPYNAWPLTVGSISILFYLLAKAPPSPKQHIQTGFFYGLGLFGCGIYWVNTSIHAYGNTPLIASIPMTLIFISFLSLLFAGMAWVFCKLRNKLAPSALFCTLWIAFEVIRSTLLTGFPWLLAGYSLIDTWFAHYAPLVGIYGLSLLTAIMATSGISLLSTKTPNSKKTQLLATLLLCGLVGNALQHRDWTHPLPSASLEVALIQGNIDQNDKWSPDFYQRTLDTYETLSRSALKPTQTETVDLLIWPEAAIPSFYHEAWQFIEKIDQLSTDHKTAWLTGVPKVDFSEQGEALYFNAIISGGMATGEYQKQKLVPFGEYIPLSNWLRELGPFFNLPMSSFSSGKPNQALLVAQDLTIAPTICYEIVYPNFVRQAAKGSNLLLTISNDAWFGDSIAPHQHFQIARMRALETGRMLIRSTNTGITGFVNEKGKTLATAPSFSQAVLQHKIIPFTGNTPYMYWGDTPIIALCILLFLYSAFKRNQHGHHNRKPNN